MSGLTKVWVTINPFNCWDLLRALLRDWTISSQASEEEGSTTISKESTPEWVETGGASVFIK